VSKPELFASSGYTISMENLKSLSGREEHPVLTMNTPVFAALADPTRRNLLENLAEHSPKTATQLAEEYPITRQGILKHLHILEQAGLVAVHQIGREKRYTLTPEPLNEVDKWVKDLSAKWDERLLRLKNYLENEDK
jgi:DNA-binding transcriptional ArsR family regulator